MCRSSRTSIPTDRAIQFKLASHRSRTAFPVSTDEIKVKWILQGKNFWWPATVIDRDNRVPKNNKMAARIKYHAHRNYNCEYANVVFSMCPKEGSRLVYSVGTNSLRLKDCSSWIYVEEPIPDYNAIHPDAQVLTLNNHTTTTPTYTHRTTRQSFEGPTTQSDQLEASSTPSDQNDKHSSILRGIQRDTQERECIPYNVQVNASTASRPSGPSSGRINKIRRNSPRLSVASEGMHESDIEPTVSGLRERTPFFTQVVSSPHSGSTSKQRVSGQTKANLKARSTAIHKDNQLSSSNFMDRQNVINYNAMNEQNVTTSTRNNTNAGINSNCESVFTARLNLLEYSLSAAIGKLTTSLSILPASTMATLVRLKWSLLSRLEKQLTDLKLSDISRIGVACNTIVVKCDCDSNAFRDICAVLAHRHGLSNSSTLPSVVNPSRISFFPDFHRTQSQS